jgi:energy-coupling factor transporter ATP-binding protein EcfA2
MSFENITIPLPNILIIGPSGSGKTSCLRNMNPDTTKIVNHERKGLPFRNAVKFKHHSLINSTSDLTAELMMKSGTDPAIEAIVIDSFQSVDEELLSTCRNTYKGFDVYTYHNKIMLDFVKQSKSLGLPLINGQPKKGGPKFVVWIGLDEILSITQTGGGSRSVRRLKVEGRELQGVIEKEFTIVLFTEVIPETVGGKEVMRYKFMTNTDGVTSAKTPMEMYSEKYIDNDLNKVIEDVKKYYGI